MECYTNELSMESMAQPWSMQYQVYSNLGQCYTGPQEGQIFYGSVQRVPGAVRGALLSPLCLANVRTPVRFYMYIMCIYIILVVLQDIYISLLYYIYYYIIYILYVCVSYNIHTFLCYHDHCILLFLLLLL